MSESTQACLPPPENAQEVAHGPLQMTKSRNSDMQEVSLAVPGHRCLSGALVYGFRHIQNLVRKIKRGQCTYDFVEVMACPAGCLNGGGQVRVEGGQAAVQKHIERLDALYHERSDVELEWPEEDELGVKLWQGLKESEGCDVWNAAFHVREKSVQSALLDW
jgi:iron only hydrogenase large subunit-like protein